MSMPIPPRPEIRGFCGLLKERKVTTPPLGLRRGGGFTLFRGACCFLLHEVGALDLQRPGRVPNQHLLRAR